MDIFYHNSADVPANTTKVFYGYPNLRQTQVTVFAVDDQGNAITDGSVTDTVTLRVYPYNSHATTAELTKTINLAAVENHVFDGLFRDIALEVTTLTGAANVKFIVTQA